MCSLGREVQQHCLKGYGSLFNDDCTVAVSIDIAIQRTIMLLNSDDGSICASFAHPFLRNKSDKLVVIMANNTVERVHHRLAEVV